MRETHLVAFSLTMPYLEPYLIRTFRSVADDITDPGLAADVKEFIGQEAQHFQNHRRINEIIKAQLGPDVAADLQAIEDRLDADYRRFNASKSRRFNLAYAEGFEAMTCAMAFTSIAEAEAGHGARIRPARGANCGCGTSPRRWSTARSRSTCTSTSRAATRIGWPGRCRRRLHFQRASGGCSACCSRRRAQPGQAHLPPWLRAGRRRLLEHVQARATTPALIDPGPIPAMILSQYAA